MGVSRARQPCQTTVPDNRAPLDATNFWLGVASASQILPDFLNLIGALIRHSALRNNLRHLGSNTGKRSP